MNPLLSSIIAAAAVILIPLVSTKLSGWILNLNAAINAMTAWKKQLVVGIITTLLTMAAQHVPGVPADLQGFNATAIGSILNWAVATLLHTAPKVSAAVAPATRAIAAPK